MSPFHYRQHQLCAEAVPLADIARAVGTPCYVYSRAEIEARFRAFNDAFQQRDHLVCYAVKANSNLAVLRLLARLGAGFDIVSGGELERVRRAGGDPRKVVFSGVGKTAAEMRAALSAGICCFNVESEPELDQLNDVAGALGVRAPIALRVNPDVDPATHPYISTGLKESKFGIPIEHAARVYEHARSLPNLTITGVASHIGSQLTEMEPFLDALERVTELIGELADLGIELQHVDLGGGLGISYRDEEPPAPDDYVLELLSALEARGSRYQRLRILIEPGRAIVGNAGVLLTQVLYLKLGGARHFAVVDAAMNDLMRPALYDAFHDIARVDTATARPTRRYDVVGPVCESGDFLGQNRELAIAAGDLLAVASAGAYGAAMSSNYNTRPRAAEVLVDGERFHVVRRRESLDDLLQLESPGAA
jgi:diaminopimelate decarboxylase